MEPSDIEDAAMFLLHLRTQRTQVGGLPVELAPKTIEDAYDIQDAHHRFAGWATSTLKVGCTSEMARQFLGIPHPIAGRVPDEGIFASGSAVPRSFFAGAPMLECEIAMRVGADGVVDAVAPAVEFVNPRFGDTSKVSGFSLIADNSAGCGAIIGAPLTVDEAGDLSNLDCRLLQGDDEIAAGNSSALDGGPQASVEWIAAHEIGRGRTLEAGTWIITGTCSGLTPTEFGSTYTADFGTLGLVSFMLE